eukprot:c25236_g4_i2 orf=165-2240(-)
MRRLRVMISLILSHMLVNAIISINPSEGIEFHYPSFNQTNNGEIKVVSQNHSWYTGADAVLIGSAFWLTPNPQNVDSKKASNIGKIVYKDTIQFKNNQSDSPQKVASFNTSFTFRITSSCLNDSCGDGMAFFISSFDQAPNNSDGAYLGLFDPDATTTSNFFAVEFDTRVSPKLHDPSASHIGIDIDSLVSIKYTDTSNSSSPFYPELYLYNNDSFKAWIAYDSSTNLIQVWMTNSSSSERPSEACLQLSYNLSTVFQDYMYVGFSAANMAGQDDMEGHAVYAWSFSSENFTQESKHSKLIVPLAVALSIILALLAFGVTLFLIKKKRRVGTYSLPSSVRTRSEKSIIQLGSNRSTLPRYSYKELKRSAQGFTDQSKVGEGAFSSVYRATLADGSIVAIKRLKQGVRKEAEFSAEMNIISSIRHRNLLQLRGWCYEKGEAILVYPYMSNGSLESYLYGDKRGTLQSETRLKILAGVASALEYLHGHLGECVLHRDVKAANVLLTDSFEPVLGDFGLARLIGHDEGAVTMTAVGTPGYIAPEVVYTGKATDKADVYSFGVLALEMAYGRPAIDRSGVQPEDARLVDYAWTLHQRNQLMEALDTCMCMDMKQKEQWRCILHVALMCCNPLPESRPTMAQVAQALKGDTVLLMELLPGTRPSYPISMNWPSASGSSTSWNTPSVTISTSKEGGS